MHREPPPGPAATTFARPAAKAARSMAASNSSGFQSMISAPQSRNESGILTPSCRRMPKTPLGVLFFRLCATSYATASLCHVVSPISTTVTDVPVKLFPYFP